MTALHEDVSWPRLAFRAGAWAGTLARHGFALRRRWLHATLVDLGPTFVKGGQLLSTRKDLLSPEACAVLGELHDRVAPMPRRHAEAALRRAYPAGIPFAEFDWTPRACGSIACVYRAALRDGRAVAVKVRRPHIQQRMRADFALLGLGANVVQRLPPMRDVPAHRMVRQVGDAVLRQLDLRAEAEALTTLRTNLDFRIPEALPDISTEGVLVMEYVDGLGRFGPGDLTPARRREVVRRVLHGVYRMLFVNGLVHCDMHPGNLYLTQSADVVLLDAGFVVTLGPVVKRLFAEFFLNMARGRGIECADVVLRSAEHVPPTADVGWFRDGVAELVASVHGRPAGQFRLAPFATRLFDLQRRSGIAAAPEFVFPLMSLLVVEGMINEFDVDVDFQAEAVPTLLSALAS